MDENDNLNFGTLVAEIESITTVDDEIKGVLLAGVNNCKSLTVSISCTLIHCI